MNPSLYIEIGRILFNLTDCVLVNRIEAPELEEIRGMDLDVIVYEFSVNRIISSLEPIFTRDICIYVFRRDRRKRIEKKLRRIMHLERNPNLDNRLKINEIEGEMLGYPECCISNFVELKRKCAMGKSMPPESKTIVECIESGVFSNIIDFFPDPSFYDDICSLFTSNFYPCSLKCKRAYGIGRKYMEMLEEPYKTAYKCKIVSNVINLLVSALETYRSIKKPKTEFGSIVFDFFNSLDSRRFERVLKIAETFKADPAGFENSYIRMILRKRSTD